MQTAVIAAYRKQRVAYVDTCCSFQPVRAHQILCHYLRRLSEAQEGRELDVSQEDTSAILNQIHVLQSHSVFDLVKKLDMMSFELQDIHRRGEKVPMDLLVIDSLSALLVPGLGAPTKTVRTSYFSLLLSLSSHTLSAQKVGLTFDELT